MSRWWLPVALMLVGCENFEQLGLGVCQRAAHPDWCQGQQNPDGGKLDGGGDAGGSDAGGDAGSVYPRVKWARRWGGMGNEVPAALSTRGHQVALVGSFSESFQLEGATLTSDGGDVLWVAFSTLDGGLELQDVGAHTQPELQQAYDVLHRGSDLIISVRGPTEGGGIFRRLLVGDGAFDQMEATKGDLVPRALADLGDGGFALAGHAAGTGVVIGQKGVYQNTAFLFRSPGAEVSIFHCPDGVTEATDLIVEPNGAVYVGGTVVAGPHLCGFPFLNVTSSMFVLRRDSDGGVMGFSNGPAGGSRIRLARAGGWLWSARSYDLMRIHPVTLDTSPIASFPSEMGIGDLAVDPQGNLVLAGYIAASVDLSGDGGTPLPHVGEHDLWVGKYTQQGALIWARSFGGIHREAAMAVAVTPTDVVVAAVCGSSTLQLDQFNLNATSSMSGNDLCVFGLEH